MGIKTYAHLLVAIALGLTGCAAPKADVAWPEPRPLGKDFQTYRPPLRPSPPASEALGAEEPTGVINLRQALSLALIRSPELAAFSWEVRAGEARTLQAGLLPNPEIEVEAENFGGTDGFKRFDVTETTIQLGQLIELGGKRSKRRRVAALERDLSGWDYETKRLDVLTEVSKAFVDVLAAQERLALNEELVRLAEKVFEAVSERVKAGKVSPVEEIRARVTLSTSQIGLDRAKRRLEASRKLLSATWASLSPTFDMVDGRMDVVKPIPSAEQLAQRISQNPDIARWVVEMAQRRAAVELEDAKRIPDLTLSGGLRRLEETDDNAFVMGLSIPIPLFNRNQGGALEARYRLAKAGEERRAMRARIQKVLANAYQELSTAFAETTALKSEVVPGAQRAFDAVSEGYRQGKFGLLGVLDTQRTLFEAKGQYLEALASYHKAVADVERLIGEPLDAVK